MPSDSESDPQVRLRLRVAPAAESIIRAGHPWVYASSVRDQNRPGQSGEIAIIYDRKDAFLALGLFDADSPLRVRILHVGKPVPIDDDWWEGRLQKALGLRSSMFGSNTTGYRLINGESDGWPGLVLDRYGETCVVKLYTPAWWPHWNLVRGLITKATGARRLVLRLSRNMGHSVPSSSMADGAVVHGADPGPTAPFLENGAQFEADVLHGQKTGFFLDQRENRRRVGELSAGKAVLNAFSYSGGFSVYAARAGATSVTEIDLSGHALTRAAANFQLNRHQPAVAACHRSAIQADVFQWLHDSRARRYDVVVLDPPSLARRETERAGAIKGYQALAEGGIRLLHRGGLLVAASCSAHVTAAEFFEAVRQVAVRSGRKSVELETRLQPPDHPASFAEAAYLKCIYLRMDREDAP